MARKTVLVCDSCGNDEEGKGAVIRASLSGEERVLTALSLQQPDVVPTFTKNIAPEAILSVARELTEGVPNITFDFMAPLPEADNLRLMELYMLIYDVLDIDGYSNRDVGILYWGAGFETVDDRHIRDAWGIVYLRSEQGIPVPVGYPVKKQADLDRLSPATPGATNFGAVTDTVRAGTAKFKGRKALIGDVLGPFSVSWFLRGQTELLMDYIGDPELAHSLARFATEAAKARIADAAAAEMSALTLNDDVAHKDNPFMSPRHYREFIAPYHRELVEFGHGLGLKMALHSDGNLWKLLDDIVACGFDGLNPLDPTAGMELKGVKEAYGDRLCLIGNLSVTDVLRNGSTAEVEEAVIEAIGDAAAGGGYILCDSSGIISDVKPENYITMMRAAKKYGRAEPGKSSEGTGAGV